MATKIRDYAKLAATAVFNDLFCHLSFLLSFFK